MYKIVVTNNTCFNIDSDEELARLQASDPNLKVLTSEEISVAGMNGYEAIVSPENTKIDPLGTVVFTAPDIDVLRSNSLAKLAEEYTAARYDGMIASSTGFTVKVDRTLDTNLTFLLLQFSVADVSTVTFLDADGVSHAITKDQVRTILAELNQYITSLDTVKKGAEDEIKQANNYSELSSISPVFSRSFTPSAVVLRPETNSAVVIDERTSGPAIARALE